MARIMALANVSGRNLYFEHHGDSVGDEPPLLLISGMAGTCQGWLPLQVPEFSAKRSVILFDHRGVGESTDTGEAFGTADLARDALGLLDALEVEKADVLGSFMGGMTAQELALLAPERIERLILVGTYACPDEKRRMLLRHWSELVQKGLSAEALVYTRLLWTLQDETMEQSDLIQSMIDFYREQDAPFSTDLFIRQCRACSEHDTRSRLGSLPHPTLLLGGRNDILTPPRFHAELSELIPNSHRVTLNYGAHLVMLESAEQFNQVVIQFLDDKR